MLVLSFSKKRKGKRGNNKKEIIGVIPFLSSLVAHKVLLGVLRYTTANV
jgi:hypothetical protein